MARDLPSNSVEVFVQDAVGGIFCHSCSSIGLKVSAIKHARWYMGLRKHVGFDGKPLSICKPLKLVVRDYYDSSADLKVKRRRP